MSTRPDNPYLRRAALYAGVDALLRNRTRFFGAAAQTNWVLGALLAPTACIALSLGTRDFLDDIGGRLESLNLDIARKVATGHYRLKALDHAIVEVEQSAVQAHMYEWRAHNAKQFDLIARQLDDLMNGRRLCGLFGRMHAPASPYIQTLDVVRRHLGRPIAFIRQMDRVSIGLALIDRLRASSPAAAGSGAILG